MWVFLNNAFLSIVADENNEHQLLVRARKEGDIEAAFGSVSDGLGFALVVAYTPRADYAYRTFVPRHHVKNLFSGIVQNIEYTNFKDSVREDKRHDTYMSVWQRMRLWQDMLHRRVGRIDKKGAIR